MNSSKPVAKSLPASPSNDDNWYFWDQLNWIASEIRYVAKTFPALEEAARKEVLEFLHALDDHDDVHHVFAAMK